MKSSTSSISVREKKEGEREKYSSIKMKSISNSISLYKEITGKIEIDL